MVKTSNRELAEDLTQETFMRYWQSLRDSKQMSNTRSFLYTIANNLIIDWYRKKKDESLDVRMESGFDPKEQRDVSAETRATYNEALVTIRELTPEDQEVLILRYVEGIDPKDIAEILGVSANVVSVRINRATKRLQEKLRV